MAGGLALGMGFASAGSSVLEAYQKTRALDKQADDIEDRMKQTKQNYLLMKARRGDEFNRLQKSNIASQGARGVDKDLESIVNDASRFLADEKIHWDNAKRTIEGMDIDIDTSNVMLNGLMKGVATAGQSYMQYQNYNALIDSQMKLDNLADDFGRGYDPSTQGNAEFNEMSTDIDNQMNPLNKY